MILQVLIAMVAGWINRHQQQAISYLIEENRVLKAQLGQRRLCLTDTQRRRLAALAHPLGRKRLKQLATLATPDTLMRWYHRLIADKFNGSKKRKELRRPRVPEEVEQLVVRMAQENPSWGYRRIQGALANLGHSIDKITIRNILRRHHIDPAPKRRQAGMSWSKFLKMHWEVLAATDFFTVEVATWHGLVTFYVFVVMELRRIGRIKHIFPSVSPLGRAVALRSALGQGLGRCRMAPLGLDTRHRMGVGMPAPPPTRHTGQWSWYPDGAMGSGWHTPPTL